MRAKRCVFAVLVLSVAALAAESPFSGTWKLNLAKSKLAPSDPTAKDIAYITVDDTSFRIREQFTDRQGGVILMTWDAKFDGKDYPVQGYPPADAVVMHREGEKIQGTMKKAGKVVSTWDATISKDGKITTVNAVDLTAKPEDAKELFIYDKQPN